MTSTHTPVTTKAIPTESTRITIATPKNLNIAPIKYPSEHPTKILFIGFDR